MGRPTVHLDGAISSAIPFGVVEGIIHVARFFNITEPIKYEHSIEARIIVDDDDDGEFEGDKFTTVKFIRAVIPVKNGDRNNYIYIDKNGRITTYVIDLAMIVDFIT